MIGSGQNLVFTDYSQVFVPVEKSASVSFRYFCKDWRAVDAVMEDGDCSARSLFSEEMDIASVMSDMFVATEDVSSVS